MKRSMIASLVAVLGACGGDSPTDQGGDGGNSVSATVAGVSFTAASVQVNAAGSGSLNFVGTTSTTAPPVLQIGFHVDGVSGPGTFDLSPSAPTNIATYTSTTGTTPSQWSTHQSGATGSLTVTSLTSNSVTGTFQFMGVADPGTAATGTINVTSGTFSLTF